MAEGKGAAKANQRARAQAFAQRNADCRAVKFQTKGFGSNEPIPSVAEARKMHTDNLRLINGQMQTPSRKMVKRVKRKG